MLGLAIGIALAGAAPPPAFVVRSMLALESRQTRVGSFTNERGVVAYGGSTFLALWQGRTPTVARIDSSGNFPDPFARAGWARPTLASSTPVAASLLAFDGTDFVAVFTGSDGVHAARLAPDLTPVDPAPLPIVRNGSVTYFPAELAASGSTHLLVLESHQGFDSWIDAIRLDRDLCPLDAAPFALAPVASEQPAAAWNGRDFVVAWVGDALSSPHALRYTRVSEGGRSWIRGQSR